MKTISQTEFQRNYKKYEKEVKKSTFIIYKNNVPAFVTIPYSIFMESELENDKEIKKAITRFVELSSSKRKTIKGKKVWEELKNL